MSVGDRVLNWCLLRSKVRRFGIPAAAAVLCIITLATVISTLGAHGALDARSSIHKKTLESTERMPSYEVNTVTAGLTDLLRVTKRGAIIGGTAAYSFNRSVADTSYQAAKKVTTGVKNSAIVVIHGIKRLGSGAHGIVCFVAGSPAKLANTVSRETTATALIAPASNSSAPLPEIDSKTAAAEYERLSLAQREQIEKLLADQAKANERLDGLVVGGDPNHGGYPAQWDNAPQDSQVDSWGMYSRECVSYAAWKVHQTYGRMPYWGGIGNANQWVRNARNVGIPTGSVPQVHSVAISLNGYYGHAMWVEAVSGNMVYISQYNYDMHGRYSEMWVDGRNFTYIYFN